MSRVFTLKNVLPFEITVVGTSINVFKVGSIKSCFWCPSTKLFSNSFDSFLAWMLQFFQQPYTRNSNLKLFRSYESRQWTKKALRHTQYFHITIIIWVHLYLISINLSLNFRSQCSVKLTTKLVPEGSSFKYTTTRIYIFTFSFSLKFLASKWFTGFSTYFQTSISYTVEGV